MVINPFKTNVEKIGVNKFNSSVENKKNGNENIDVAEFQNDNKGNSKCSTYRENIEINILLLQKYVINNYMEYVQKGLKEELAGKIGKYLYDKYNLKEEQKIKDITDILLNKMFGYDILQKYIDMKGVTDIRAVKYDSIYIKIKGDWQKVEEKFLNEEEFEEYVRYCVLKNNANINFDTSLVIVSDKKYNLRIEAGISPANSMCPSLVIRIHRHNTNISLESLFIQSEMLDATSYKIITAAIRKEKNIVISGKGGSGKTSLLRAIVDKIPDQKAITINEETMELYIENKNVIQREVLQNRSESKKITLEKLMQHCLVMSNDVLVVR
ncbi:MAG: ATPase, T2SS/T4P/T4SS family [Clostridia bacterium]